MKEVISILIFIASIIYAKSCMDKWKRDDAFVKHLEELSKQPPEIWQEKVKRK